jgi:hypothetical protein
MTNREKFKEVFGFTPDSCPLPKKICVDTECKECVFFHFWDREYRECFQLKEEFE